MTAEEWMVRGYLAAFNGSAYEPPNYHIDAAAYEHGWRNGEDDRSTKPPRGTIAEKREHVANILAAEAAELVPPQAHSPQDDTDAYVEWRGDFLFSDQCLTPNERPAMSRIVPWTPSQPRRNARGFGPSLSRCWFARLDAAPACPLPTVWARFGFPA